MTAAWDALRGRVLSPLDEHFARAVGRLAGEERADVLLAAALASRQVSRGHVCLELARLVEDPPVDDLRWPALAGWIEALRSSGLVADAATAEREARPLVLDARGRLYLKRYWDHQRRLAAAIRHRAAAVDASLDIALLRDGLDRLFPADASAGAAPDWQRIAALTAVQRGFCVISGGPGTGKTFTVVKILALLIEQAQRAGRRVPRLHLVAPTGKAAARLGEAIRNAKGDLRCAAEVRAAIPTEATTIHRCLGAIRGRPASFRHDAGNPLITDLVLVDEASMVDLALMARLVDALPAQARLILLGDKDQLASVEAGAVLGDICNTGAARRYSRPFVESVAAISGERLPLDRDAPEQTGVWDCIVQLTRSYRYRADSGIGALARAVNGGDAAAALAALSAGGDTQLRAPGREWELSDALRADVVQQLDGLRAAALPQDRLRALERFRILCAHRRGGHGVETVNALVEATLAEAGILRIDAASYAGRPVMVTRNDYQIGLFNGDVGVIAVDPDDAERRVAVFAAPDGTVRMLSPSRLPPHETVFAMSVHKSQGSEFDEVAVVLPDRVSPVVSRELLYTAVTRARRAVTVYASPEILAAAVARPVERASGLRELLWGD